MSQLFRVDVDDDQGQEVNVEDFTVALETAKGRITADTRVVEIYRLITDPSEVGLAL
jgi:hypothetical protein